MQAGVLRHRITIERHNPGTKNAQGFPSTAWEPVLSNIPSDVKDLSGRELYGAQQTVAEATTKVIMRGYSGWRAQIKSSCRIVCQDGDVRFFDVKVPINPDGKDRWLEILCVEIV